MNKTTKDLLHTLLLLKEKLTNQKISRYDSTGNTNIDYIQEYWGNTKGEIEQKWLKLSSKHYLILWIPPIILFFIIAMIVNAMEVEGEGNLITNILNFIAGILICIAGFGTSERRKKAREMIWSLTARKEREEKQKYEQQAKAAREKIRQQERQRKHKKIEELNKQFGKPFGECVYYKRVEKKMGINAVIASWSSPKLKKGNVWYYPQRHNRTLTLLNFIKEKVSSISIGKKPFELDMSKKELIAIWGSPRQKKETVFKTKTKQKLYYFSRKTRQNTTVYEYEVNLENDIVVGWKKLG